MKKQSKAVQEQYRVQLSEMKQIKITCLKQLKQFLFVL